MLCCRKAFASRRVPSPGSQVSDDWPSDSDSLARRVAAELRHVKCEHSASRPPWRATGATKNRFSAYAGATRWAPELLSKTSRRNGSPGTTGIYTPISSMSTPALASRRCPKSTSGCPKGAWWINLRWWERLNLPKLGRSKRWRSTGSSPIPD